MGEGRARPEASILRPAAPGTATLPGRIVGQSQTQLFALSVTGEAPGMAEVISRTRNLVGSPCTDQASPRRASSTRSSSSVVL